MRSLHAENVQHTVLCVDDTGAPVLSAQSGPFSSLLAGQWGRTAWLDGPVLRLAYWATPANSLDPLARVHTHEKSRCSVTVCQHVFWSCTVQQFNAHQYLLWNVAMTFFWPLNEVNISEMLFCEMAHFVLQHFGNLKKIMCMCFNLIKFYKIVLFHWTTIIS